MAAGKTTTRCPFLREAQVKSCAASGVRKLIVRLPAGAAPERCSSPGYDSCPSSKQYRSDVVVGSHCPFLQESLVQYCAAAPVVKYIPYSESVLSRCGSGQHATCELFAAIAGAGNGGGAHDEARPAPLEGRRPAAPERFPGRLWYAANHMWLDAGPGLSWRIGVDSFFTGLFGALDRIEFPARRGHRVPEALFSSGGTAFTISFPAAMMITEFNMYLLSNPSNLLSDPYGTGWLFRGLDDGAGTPGERRAIAEGLIPGADVGRWIDAEERRMTSFVHDLRNRGEGIVTMADGGTYQEKLFACLDAGQRRELVERFFTPPAGREGGR